MQEKLTFHQNSRLSATEPLPESLINLLIRQQDWGIPKGWLDVMSWKTHEPQDHRHSGALHQHCWFNSVKIKLRIFKNWFADASANMWKRMIHILPQLLIAWIQVSHTVVDLQLGYLWNESQFFSTRFIAKTGEGWTPINRVDMDGHTKMLTKKGSKLPKHRRSSKC